MPYLFEIFSRLFLVKPFSDTKIFANFKTSNLFFFIYRNPNIEEGEKIKVSVLINPQIEKISDEIEDEWEGCLSIPGMSGLVRRSKKIKYSGIDITGNKINGEAEGLHARVIQHEYDHLNGILYTSRLADKRAFGYSEEIEKFWKKKDEETSK